MGAARPLPSSGNSAWATALAVEVREVVSRASNRAPRSQQVHLGPSELGVTCDRQVVAKLLQEPSTNHVADPWPSVVGTAVHAWLADAFELDNTVRGHNWFTERRVTPHPDHSGTADLYSIKHRALLDHKVLGETSMQKVKRPQGPPPVYQVQLGLYALGYLREGWPVDRVGLIAYPRTRSSIHDIYVWERAWDQSYVDLVKAALLRTSERKEMAAQVRNGLAMLDDIPIAPDDDQCYFCPFYRPQSAHDGQTGCPGPRKGN